MLEDIFDEINLTVLGDERGSLVAVESQISLPIDIVRTYYIFGTKNDVTRGNHAHYKLQQYMVCVCGSCNVLLDDGYREVTVKLDRPNRCISINPMVWHSMSNFSSDTVILVFADAVYDESDYIRDYSDFKKAVTL